MASRLIERSWLIGAQLGTHAVARDAAGGVGGAEEGRREWLGRSVKRRVVASSTSAYRAITDRSTTSARRCSWIYEQQFPTATGAGSTPRRQARFSASTVYFFGGETVMLFVTLTTPSVSFASRSASALACSFGTVPFR